MRHELEQALVERFGDRRFDPLGTRREEFCDPDCFGRLMEVVDQWRERFPDALSESLWSEDAGASYGSHVRCCPTREPRPACGWNRLRATPSR
jgi:hypothetical protein